MAGGLALLRTRAPGGSARKHLAQVRAAADADAVADACAAVGVGGVTSTPAAPSGTRLAPSPIRHAERKPLPRARQAEVIGHRGAGRLAPPNTVAAFMRARALKLDGFATDICFTKDLQFVITSGERGGAPVALGGCSQRRWAPFTFTSMRRVASPPATRPQ